MVAKTSCSGGRSWRPLPNPIPSRGTGDADHERRSGSHAQLVASALRIDRTLIAGQLQANGAMGSRPWHAADVRRVFDAEMPASMQSVTSFVSLLSSSGVTIGEIAHLVGHGSTSVTERVYRKELRPVITRGARAINGRLALRVRAEPLPVNGGDCGVWSVCMVAHVSHCASWLADNLADSKQVGVRVVVSAARGRGAGLLQTPKVSIRAHRHTTCP